MLSHVRQRPLVLFLATLPLLATTAWADSGNPAEYHVVLAGQQQAQQRPAAPAALGAQDSRLQRQRAKKRQRPRPHRQLPDFYQLYSAPGFQVSDPDRAWGTFTTVTRLREVCQAYHQQFPEAAPLMVHDLSRRRGGRLEPHVSHRTGRDVDMRLLLKHTTAYVKASPRSLHLERMWFLLRSLVQTGDVQYIFLDVSLQRALYRYAKRQGVSPEELRATFQYPRRGQAPGIIRHEPGHRDHIHIRFFRRPAQSPPLLASAS